MLRPPEMVAFETNPLAAVFVDPVVASLPNPSEVCPVAAGEEQAVNLVAAQLAFRPKAAAPVADANPVAEVSFACPQDQDKASADSQGAGLVSHATPKAVGSLRTDPSPSNCCKGMPQQEMELVHEPPRDAVSSGAGSPARRPTETPHAQVGKDQLYDELGFCLARPWSIFPTQLRLGRR